MITGFVEVDEKEKKAIGESFSISLGNSPFQDKVVFKITGFTFKKAENDGKVDKDARKNPVLTTTVGDCFLSMCTKAKVTDKSKILEPNGTFNTYIKETIATMHGKNNETILQQIVDDCKDKEICVTRVPYSALGKNGSYVAYATILNFKN